MNKNLIKLSIAVTFFAAMIGASITTEAYPPFLRKATKFGAKDCLFCHKTIEGGEGWNPRGDWLIAEKDRRKADAVDVEWLAEYKEAGAAEEQKGDKDSKDSKDKDKDKDKGKGKDKDKAKDDASLEKAKDESGEKAADEAVMSKAKDEKGKAKVAKVKEKAKDKDKDKEKDQTTDDAAKEKTKDKEKDKDKGKDKKKDKPE